MGVGETGRLQPGKKFLQRLVSQLNKADPNANNRELRTFGTLGVLRHPMLTFKRGAGNEVPEDINQCSADYLWNQVLLPDNLLNILGRFIGIQIEEKEDWEGRKYKKEVLIFPSYHQWDVVVNSTQCQF